MLNRNRARPADGAESSQIQTAAADGGTGVWDHQRGDGVPAVPVARTPEGLAGVDVGVRELQPQTDVRAQKSGQCGLRMNERGRSGRRIRINASDSGYGPLSSEQK